MPAPPVTLIDPEGRPHEMPADQAGGALDQPGWRLQTDADRLERISGQAKEADYGGAGGTIKAGAAGLARGATLGLSDVALAGLGGEDTAFDLRALREVNPGVSTGTEIAGALAPALISGGAATPAGAVARAGRGIAELGAESGALGKIGYSALGGAAEGALFGAGSGVSELALSDDPLTVQHVASTLSSNALYGAALGGGLGGLGKAAEIGLGRAKTAIDGALEQRAAKKASTVGEAIDTGDLESLNPRKLKEAREAELERLDTDLAPERKSIADDIHEYRDTMHDHDLFHTTNGVADGGVRELGGSLKRADRAIRNALDNKTRLASKPEAMLGALQQQEQAMEEIQRWAAAQREAFDARIASLDQDLRSDILAGKLPGEIGPFTAKGLNLAVERASQARFDQITRDPLLKKIGLIEDKFPGAVETNYKLQQRISKLAAKPESVRLGKIEEALEALNAPAEPSLGQAVLSVVPFAGPLGIAAASGARAIGGLRKVGAAVATRSAKAASAFLDVAGKATAKASPRAPLVASKLLGALSYAPAQPAGVAVARASASKMSPLALAFHDRTDEVKSQVHIAPDGSFEVRPATRERIAAKFDGVRAADPKLADQMETLASRRLAYLASIIPRLPDYGTVQIGPERRTVSDQAMRSWARAAGAVEDPDGVLERAAHGAVVPEEVAAIRAVYPDKLNAYVEQVIESLPTMPRNLPYKRRLTLSILTGRPIDPAMAPGVLNVIQGMYAAEPGTQGGTQAPTPEPQFGSVRADKGTQAQQRQGEHA